MALALALGFEEEWWVRWCAAEEQLQDAEDGEEDEEEEEEEEEEVRRCRKRL
jgi:hypothetical protein